MTTNDIIIDAFERIKEVVHRTTDGLDQKSLTYRPGKDANTIAWLIWHLARAQDVQIADIAVHEQVWTADGWYEKSDLPFDSDASGYGQSSEDVAKVQVNAKLLIEYYDAVHEKTVDFITTITAEDLEKVVDTRWDPPVTMAARLVSIISDDMQHAGQAAYIRGLIN